jgi:hypothetical protein
MSLKRNAWSVNALARKEMDSIRSQPEMETNVRRAIPMDLKMDQTITGVDQVGVSICIHRKNLARWGSPLTDGLDNDPAGAHHYNWV